jgi:2-polyprenyl-6-hydroxyphenyl methylase/3-demethylubiquinone-9 3-methyltransferase
MDGKAEGVMRNSIFYAFGKNWASFVEHDYLEERLDHAVVSLKQSLGIEDSKGKSFLDVGCGSGLFSLAAYKLGARNVTSFDVDDNSVACCRKLAAAEGNPANWEIIEASILDATLIEWAASQRIRFRQPYTMRAA